MRLPASECSAVPITRPVAPALIATGSRAQGSARRSPEQGQRRRTHAASGGGTGQMRKGGSASLYANSPESDTQSAARPRSSASAATPSAPARNNVLDHTSASAGSWSTTVTASSPTPPGRPVRGSTRWWTTSPSCVHRQRRTDEVAQARSTTASTASRIVAAAGILDAEAPRAAVRTRAARHAVAARVDEQGRTVRGDPLRRPARGEPLADAAQVDRVGPDPDPAGRAVDLRQPRLVGERGVPRGDGSAAATGLVRADGEEPPAACHIALFVRP